MVNQFQRRHAGDLRTLFSSQKPSGRGSPRPSQMILDEDLAHPLPGMELWPHQVAPGVPLKSSGRGPARPQ